MKNDLKTAGNRPQTTLISKLRNRFRDILLKWEGRAVLQTNISAACWANPTCILKYQRSQAVQRGVHHIG